MLDAGKYRAVATSAILTETKNGKEHVAIDLRITQGQSAGECLSWQGWLGERSVARTMESLRACGWLGQNLAEIDIEELCNEVSITVEHEEYNGKTYAKVRWINPGIKPLEAGKAAALAKRLAAQAAAIAPIPGKPPVVVAVEPGDDDLPF